MNKQQLSLSTFVLIALMLNGALVTAASGADSDMAKTRNSVETEGKSSEERQNAILEQRMAGGMGVPFYQLENAQLKSNHQGERRSISIQTKSDKISKTILVSQFPSFYKPTLRQFLDAIALQTHSQWNYDAAKSEADGKSPIVFEFKEGGKRKPYELNLAKDWSTKDNGNWVLCSPAGESTGMDIYDLGNFTSISKSNEAELLKEVPQQVAFEWAKRVQHKAKPTDLKKSHVGEYDAVFYESTVKDKNSKDVHWRHWVFMAGNRCFFIASTVYPDRDKTIFPDIEGMLKTFKLRKAE